MIETVAATRQLTVDEFLALDLERAELIDGIVMYKASPSGEHSFSEGHLMMWLGRRFVRQPGGRWPGGWWIGPEIDVIYGRDQLFCHDLAGWRRDRTAEKPSGRTRIRPDWVCEVLSPKHEKRDLVDKMKTLHRAGVPFYWIFDYERSLVSIYKHDQAGYVIAMTFDDED